MKQYKYKFSIIMAIYNVENYLEEAIESVINQTLAFEENVQLILVNDGSPDNSEKICLKYKELYPENIIYLKQENKGVSSARNFGIKYAEGEFINFLDSDDKFENNVLEEVNRFFEENYKEIDVVAIPMKHFEASDKYHILHYKFRENKVINIMDNYNFIQLSTSSAFIKKESIKDRVFDSKMRYLEDAYLITDIILDKLKYGIVSSTLYLCRKRENNTSATQNLVTNKLWYNETLKLFHKRIIDMSKARYNTVLNYIQYIVMYDLEWRLTSKNINQILTKAEKEEYIYLLKDILKNISNRIILEQREIWSEHKIRALNLKYDTNIINESIYNDGKIYFRNKKIYSIKDSSIVTINVINIEKNILELTGQILSPFKQEDVELYIKNNNKLEKIETYSIQEENNCELKEEIYYSNKFTIKYEITNNIFEFYIKYKDNDLILVSPYYTQHARLLKKARLHFKYKNILMYNKKEKLICKKYNYFTSLKREISNQLHLLKKKKFKQLIIRNTYFILNIFKFKEIWIVSDRITAANDNGMHMFKYINSIKPKNINCYFAISKNCEDYYKMKKIGKVINIDNFMYKLYFLLSDKIISSQADNYLINAFGNSNIYYRDLYKFKFIFLQHGVTKDDISGWLNKNDKNIALFVTTGETECNSIKNIKYGYTDKEVKITGFPRFDNLIDESKKIIAIMPTWRKANTNKIDYKTGIRSYNHDFINSNYFKFYNNLINDEKLLKVMTKYGYKGLFVVHPSNIENAKDFKGNSIFEVNDKIADYQEIFKTAKLLISDYSSVPFDFAYLRKAIIYTQFDREEFFSSHTYTEGYYSYEKDGFGPVIYNYEDTVKEIIKSIENDCKVERKYLNRINSFYTFDDKKNCERCYNEIKKL